MRTFITSALTGGGRMYRRLREIRHALSPRSRTEIFSDIYLNNAWGNLESASGRGSTLGRTAAIRSALPGWLERAGATSLLDAACGDYNWMRDVDLGGIEYIGADVVPELIARNRRLHGRGGRRFVVLDVVRDEIPKVDVILCRDCFIHLSLHDIRATIANFKRSRSGFLLATTHASVRPNTDIRTGAWRPVNLRVPPLDFPPPLQEIAEDAELGKYLGMWRLDSL